MEYLVFILDLFEDVLRKGVCAVYNLDTPHDFSDFLAYRWEFRSLFNVTIADVELLVRASYEVRTTWPIGRLLEADLQPPGRSA